MGLADLGLIGNCQISALVSRDGSIVWCCMPRFDSPPVFGALLDDADGGRFAIGPAEDLFLAPLYRIDGRTNPGEEILADWPGYLGNGPVRIGNAAALHRQNDVFGEMVLAPFFLDARFREQVTTPVPDLVTELAREAVRVAGQPDARRLLDHVQSIPSPLGLLSEDVDPTTGTMWGNCPQAYSHAGFIHAAFAVSPPWAEVS